jgi:hypothetical protein
MGILDYQDSATRAKKLLQLFGPASSAWGELRSSLSFPLHTPQPQPTPSLPPMHTAVRQFGVPGDSIQSSNASRVKYVPSACWGKTHRVVHTINQTQPNPTANPTRPNPTQLSPQERALERYYRLWSRRRGSSRAPSGTHSTTRCVA